MKCFNSVLLVLPFVLAITTAIGSKALVDHTRGKRISDGRCVTGSLLPPPAGKKCTPDNTFTRCQVVIQDSGEAITVTAYQDNGSCRQELFYDN